MSTQNMSSSFSPLFLLFVASQSHKMMKYTCLVFVTKYIHMNIRSPFMCPISLSVCTFKLFLTPLFGQYTECSGPLHNNWPGSFVVAEALVDPVNSTREVVLGYTYELYAMGLNALLGIRLYIERKTKQNKKRLPWSSLWRHLELYESSLCYGS